MNYSLLHLLPAAVLCPRCDQPMAVVPVDNQDPGQRTYRCCGYQYHVMLQVVTAERNYDHSDLT